MSGIIGADRSRTGVIQQSTLLAGRANWSSLYRVTGGESAWVDNSTSPTIVTTIDLNEDSNTAAVGEGSSPSSATNPLVIDVEFTVAKAYNGNAQYYMDIYMGGGGLGSGFVSGNYQSTIAASTLCLGRVTWNIPDNTTQKYAFRVVDKNPGATPTYQIMRVGTPSITYTFTSEQIIIYEVGQGHR